MSQVTIERRRTGLDVVVGVLLVIAGLVILGNVVLATAVTALFIGWMALISGVVELVSSLFKIRSGNFWSHALGGAALTVLGLFVLRNPAVTVVVITLLAGALFLTTGLTRVFVACTVEPVGVRAVGSCLGRARHRRAVQPRDRELRSHRGAARGPDARRGRHDPSRGSPAQGHLRGMTSGGGSAPTLEG